MPITPEMARAELDRRKQLLTPSNIITPEMARAELARRGMRTSEKTNKKEKEEPKYQRGQSSLDFTPEEIEKYNQRREKSTKKAPWLPNFLYPTGEEMAQEAQTAAKGIRNIATVPASVADLPFLPYNVGAAIAGKQGFVPSGYIGEKIDNLTNNYTRPESNMEKVNEAVMQSVLPMKTISTIGNKLAGNASSWINKPGKFLQSSNAITPGNVAATTAGAAGTQQFMNLNPEAGPGSTMTAGLLATLAGGKIGKNIDWLSNPNAAAARVHSVNSGKVKNQLKDSLGSKVLNQQAREMYNKLNEKNQSSDKEE